MEASSTVRRFLYVHNYLFLVFRCTHSRDMQERGNMLMEKDQLIEKQNLKSSREEGSKDNVSVYKSLSAALDSFDNLFCRRCLVCGFCLGILSLFIVWHQKASLLPSKIHE